MDFGRYSRRNIQHDGIPRLDSACQRAFVIGGVTLIFVPFDRKRGRNPWAKCLLAASAVLLVLKGGVHLLVYYHLWTPSPIMQRGLPHTMATFGGIILGFLPFPEN